MRERIGEAWQALYRMLDDDNVKVRRVAWHTLEDGSKFDDPGLDEIIERNLKCNDGKWVLGFARQLAQGWEQHKEIEFAVSAISDWAERGKCD